MTMFVYIHLAFNCFHLYGTQKTEHLLKNKDYDPRVRSINEDFRRELLHTKVASNRNTLEQNQGVLSENQESNEKLEELPGYENTLPNQMEYNFHDMQHNDGREGGEKSAEYNNNDGEISNQ